MLWHQDETETITSMWMDGYSAGTIAKELPGRSRMAVIGRARRLGLKQGQPIIRLPQQHYGRKPGSKNKPKREPEPYTGFRNIPLEDLEYDQCRFMEGDPHNPKDGFCGNETVLGKSWCPHHYAIVFTEYR